MKFLFIYDHLHLGGIETLIVRLSNWLVKHDHSVTILLHRKKGDLFHRLNKNVNIHSLGFFSEIGLLYSIKFKKYRDYDIYFSFSPSNLWITYLLFQKGEKKTKQIVNGVYHKKDFEMYSDEYNREIFNSILPDFSKIFMTDLVMKYHEGIFNRSFLNAFIWPLPIDAEPFLKINRKPEKYKILSIGRLTGFKTYNLYMIDVVKKLIENGYNIIYEIYGTGSLKEQMEAKIQELKLKDKIQLKGNIKYEKIPYLMETTFVFIGMGTSAIEAAYARVPSIAAISFSQEAISHGFIHQLPDLNCGQYDENLHQYQVYDLIVDLIRKDDLSYMDFCEQSFKSLKRQYDIDRLMQQFIIRFTRISTKTEFQQIETPYKYITQKSISRVKTLVKRYIKKMLKKT